MNRINRASLALAFACTSVAGCSSFGEIFEARPIAGTDLAPAAEKIAVYESSPPGPRQYRIVKRLWTQTWQSAFDVPHYASVEAGTADLRNRAAALGGDAIVNFGCYGLPRDSEVAWFTSMVKARMIPKDQTATPAVPAHSRTTLVCNGTVIRYES